MIGFWCRSGYTWEEVRGWFREGREGDLGEERGVSRGGSCTFIRPDGSENRCISTSTIILMWERDGKTGELVLCIVI